MMRDAPGMPPRPTNQEILKARDDHTKDVSAVCQRVVEMGKAGIEARIFMVGSPQLTLVESMIVELRSAVQYRRRRMQGGRLTH